MICQQALEIFTSEKIENLDLYRRAWQHVWQCRKRRCPAKSFWQTKQAQMDCKRAAAILKGEESADAADHDLAFWHALGACKNLADCPAARYVSEVLLPGLFFELEELGVKF